MNDELSNFPVTDRKSFIQFIDSLLEDYNENPETWENKSIVDFLAALSTYTEDIQDFYDNRREKVNADVPSWKTFAHILKAATLYNHNLD